MKIFYCVSVTVNLNAAEYLPYDYSVEHPGEYLLDVLEKFVLIPSFVDPVIQKSLIQLAEMGFRNQGGSFIHLLENVNGDIIDFFDKYGIENIFGQIEL